VLCIAVVLFAKHIPLLAVCGDDRGWIRGPTAAAADRLALAVYIGGIPVCCR